MDLPASLGVLYLICTANRLNRASTSFKTACAVILEVDCRLRLRHFVSHKKSIELERMLFHLPPLLVGDCLNRHKIRIRKFIHNSPPGFLNCSTRNKFCSQLRWKELLKHCGQVHYSFRGQSDMTTDQSLRSPSDSDRRSRHRQEQPFLQHLLPACPLDGFFVGCQLTGIFLRDRIPAISATGAGFVVN